MSTQTQHLHLGERLAILATSDRAYRTLIVLIVLGLTTATILTMVLGWQTYLVSVHTEQVMRHLLLHDHR